MTDGSLRVTCIGGPTALIELAGLRLLTDPTFDPAPSEYPTPVYVLRKTRGPAIPAESIGAIDVVLLSHDHHFDNLDRAGRQFLEKAGLIVTTAAGAARLGGRAVGLERWATQSITSPDGRVLSITATPARHGPADGDRGPVIGFVLTCADGRGPTVYVTGDTVWFEGIPDIAQRFDPDVVVLFAGAARVREVGPAHLTFTADESVLVARAFPRALVVPVHCDGWAHFSETCADVDRAFRAAALQDRLRLLAPGETMTFP